MSLQRGGVRRAIRLVVPALLCALALALLLPAAPAAAHATLVGTDPVEGTVLTTAPERLTLTFDESVRLPGGAVTVFDAEGQEVDAEARAVDAEVQIVPTGELTEGTFVVSWRIISSDGHPVAGSLTFSVGQPSAVVKPPPPPPTSSFAMTSVLGVVQGLSYLGLLIAGGLALFAVLLLPRARVADPLRRRLRRVAGRWALVAGAASLLAVPLAAAYQVGGEVSDLARGEVWSFDLLRDPLVVAVAILAGLGGAVRLLPEEAPDVRRTIGVLLPTGVAVAAPALVGHTRSYEPTLLLMIGDVLHLGAGAIWIGGLVGLALTLGALGRREGLAAATLARFSTYAAGSVLALALTGSFLAWRIAGSWAVLVETAYGRLLLVKIGVALLVVAIAAYNRWRLLPGVAAAAGHADRQRPVGRVRRAVAAEAALLAVVLAATGFLVYQSPRGAVGDAAQGGTNAQTAVLSDDYRVVGLLTPGTTGQNSVSVQIQTLTGDPVDVFAAPTVVVRSETTDLGSIPVVSSDAGTYRADVVLPGPGLWEVQVSLRLSEFDNPVSTLRFPVP